MESSGRKQSYNSGKIALLWKTGSSSWKTENVWSSYHSTLMHVIPALLPNSWRRPWTGETNLSRSHTLTVNYSNRQEGHFCSTMVTSGTKSPQFDMPMGSYDGAEICELVGLFLLDEIVKANIGMKKENMGIYRDDGLGVAQGTGTQMETRRKCPYDYQRH